MLLHHRCGEGKKNLETKWMPGNWGMIEKNCGTPILWMCICKRFEKYVEGKVSAFITGRVMSRSCQNSCLSGRDYFLLSHRTWDPVEMSWFPGSWYHRAKPRVPSCRGLHRSGSGRRAPQLLSQAPRACKYTLSSQSNSVLVLLSLRYRENTVWWFDWTDLEM